MPKFTLPSKSTGRGTATRSRIMAAAVELVAERGWGAVTTRAVAERAGVNQGLVHYHFESVDALLREAVIGALETSMGEAAGPLEDPDFARAIAGTLEAIEAFDPGSPAAALMAEAFVRAIRDPFLAQPVVAGLHSFRQLIAARVDQAIADGEALPDLAGPAFPTILTALLDGLLVHRIVDPSTDIAGTRDLLLRLALVPPAHSTGDPT